MIEGSTLPEGWQAEREQRPQGEQLVVLVPADDPRLGVLDGQPAPAAEQAAPAPPPDTVPVAHQGRQEPPEARSGVDAPPAAPAAPTAAVDVVTALGPLLAQLAEQDRAAAARWREIAALSQQLGEARGDARLAQALAEELRQQLAVERARAAQLAEALARVQASPWRRLWAILWPA
jgi:hypothetical protein